MGTILNQILDMYHLPLQVLVRPYILGCALQYKCLPPTQNPARCGVLSVAIIAIYAADMTVRVVAFVQNRIVMVSVFLAVCHVLCSVVFYAIGNVLCNVQCYMQCSVFYAVYSCQCFMQCTMFNAVCSVLFNI